MWKSSPRKSLRVQKQRYTYIREIKPPELYASMPILYNAHQHQR